MCHVLYLMVCKYISQLTTQDIGVIHREWDRTLEWQTMIDQKQVTTKAHATTTLAQLSSHLGDDDGWPMHLSKSSLLSSWFEPMSFIESYVVWRVKGCNTQTHLLFSLAPTSKCQRTVCEIDAWNFSVSTTTWSCWAIPDWKVQTKFV